MKRLANKVALITGAASGIGRSTAELFCKEGANVILSDIDNEKGLESLELCKKISSRCEYIQLDVSKESDWIRVFDHISNKYNNLDILVNNAGITGITETKGPHDPENLNLASWKKVHQVNSDGVALGCKYAIKAMKANGGSIVNISSRSGLVGIPQVVAYASSKASVRNHTKSVALFCADNNYNIRCNSIHPGAILTPMWDDVLGNNQESRESNIKKISNEIPLKRMGKPIDVAYAVLYLASDESQFVTGIELNIDGGILAGSSATPKAN